jgi:hypothetical protein
LKNLYKKQASKDVTVMKILNNIWFLWGGGVKLFKEVKERSRIQDNLIFI